MLYVVDIGSTQSIGISNFSKVLFDSSNTIPVKNLGLTFNSWEMGVNISRKKYLG